MYRPRLNVTTSVLRVPTLGVKCVSTQAPGRRLVMEDFVCMRGQMTETTNADDCQLFVAVFDGHCGVLAAQIAADQLSLMIMDGLSSLKNGDDSVQSMVRRVMVELDHRIWMALGGVSGNAHLSRCGTTCTCLFVYKNTMYVVHMGDCRLIVRHPPQTYVSPLDGQEVSIAMDPDFDLLALTVDHKVCESAELQRITTTTRYQVELENSGGRFLMPAPVVIQGSKPILVPALNVSRGLGDFAYKSRTSRRFMTTAEQQLVADIGDGVSNVPDIVSYPLSVMRGARLYLVSDGISDMLTDAQLEQLHTSYDQLPISDSLARITGCDVVAHCLSKGAVDNMTLIVIDFDHAVVAPNNKEANEEVDT